MMIAVCMQHERHCFIIIYCRRVHVFSRNWFHIARNHSWHTTCHCSRLLKQHDIVITLLLDLILDVRILLLRRQVAFFFSKSNCEWITYSTPLHSALIPPVSRCLWTLSPNAAASLWRNGFINVNAVGSGSPINSPRCLNDAGKNGLARARASSKHKPHAMNDSKNQKSIQLKGKYTSDSDCKRIFV